MRERKLILASVAIVTTLIAASVATGARLPPGARLAVHWNLAGEVDGYAAKWTALLVLPLLIAGVAAGFAWLPRLEPWRDGLERSAALYRSTWTTTLTVLALTHSLVLATALGWTLPVDRLVLGALGVMFALIGNYLPKSRRMALIGIRTPWTLASEDVWIATHRLGGRLMLGCGVIFVALALHGPTPGMLAAVLIAAVLAVAVVPMVHSWLVWRRLPR